MSALLSISRKRCDTNIYKYTCSETKTLPHRHLHACKCNHGYMNNENLIHAYVLPPQPGCKQTPRTSVESPVLLPLLPPPTPPLALPSAATPSVEDWGETRNTAWCRATAKIRMRNTTESITSSSYGILTPIHLG